MDDYVEVSPPERQYLHEVPPGMPVVHACGTCREVFPSVKVAEAHVRAEHRGLGEVTTRELLEELRLRGDLAMTTTPGTERGADGAVLSAIASATLRSSTLATLEAVRGA